MFLTIDSIALAIQTKLNTLASTLYTAESVTNKIVFKVTANIDEYYKITEMEYAVGDEITYTPVLLQSVFSTMEDDFASGFYLEDYLLSVYGFERDKTDLSTILDNYSYSENATDREVVSGWVIKKTTERSKFVQTFTDTSGNNLPRAVYTLGFSWRFQLGGILSDDVAITVNGSAVEYVALSYTTEKLLIPNMAYGSANTKPVGASGFTLSLTLPIQVSNTTHKTLFEDMTSKKINQSYTVVLTFSTFKTLTYTMTLRSGSINYERDQIVSFTLTFEEALPRTVVTVDSVAVPVLSMSMQSQRIITDAITSGIEAKYEVNTVNPQWTIRFAYDSTQSKNVELLRAILDSSYYNTQYVLGITVSGITAKTYNVVLASGTYSFEQTGELIYECVFMLKAGI